MTASEWFLEGLHDGLTVLIYVLGAVLPFLIAIAIGYATLLAGFMAHVVYLDRKRRRLEPGVDRPYGIDRVREGWKP